MLRLVRDWGASSCIVVFHAELAPIKSASIQSVFIFLKQSPHHHPALPFHIVLFCMHSALCPSALVKSLRDSALALAGDFPWNVRVVLCAWYCLGWFGFRASLSRLGACSVAGCWLESKLRDLADASMHWLGASISWLCCINSSSFDPSSTSPFLC